MKIIKILIGILLAAIIVLSWFWLSAKPVEGITDRDNYEAGGLLAINVKNNLGKAVCFSSCYPYLVERRDSSGNWRQYDYDECLEPDLAADCIPANGVKKFRLSLVEAEAGFNRLQLRVCVDCAPNDRFAADSALYSNIFEIK